MIKRSLKVATLFVAVFLCQLNTAAQENLNLKNVLVVAQQDDISDRYSLEVALLQLFSNYKVKSKASLNVIKQGATAEALASDSIRQQLKEEGIDTYLLVSVRGYDNKFNSSKAIKDFDEEINAGHLFPLYRENASRVTFTFTFYRDLEPVHQELIRTGMVGNKETVLKKLSKKVEKRLTKAWL